MGDLDFEAHVWLTMVDGAARRRPAWLDVDESARWRRYLRPADRDLFLVAHTHLRHTLSRYVDVTPARWQFTREAEGRPELVAGDAPGLRFNLSHTRGLVACIVTADASCGVDVEHAGRPLDIDGVAERSFHRLERAAVARRPSDFLAFWTLKESYCKATGRGMREPLREIRFTLGERPTVAFDGRSDSPEGWHFEHLRPTDEHHMAVALRPSRTVTVHWT